MATAVITHAGVLSLIGNTPLVALQRVVSPKAATVLAKAEFLNPGGSIKDRVAKYIIERAEERRLLQPGSTILEVTTGATGISFAMVGAAKGYRVRILMPKTASIERRQIIQSYGAELELIDDVLHINDARRDAEERAKKDPRVFLPRQFSNPLSVAAQREGTGREIIAQTGSDVDALVMGVGTGGTLMGIGEALRHANRRIKIIAVEPAESAILSGDPPGPHGIHGLATGFIPEIVNLGRIDRIIKVRTQDAADMTLRLATEEALLVGISSGANIVAARQVAEELGAGKKVVTLLLDRGERYMSVWPKELD